MYALLSAGPPTSFIMGDYRPNICGIVIATYILHTNTIKRCKTMSIKLIKRDQQNNIKNKPAEAPSVGRLRDSTQAWVDEYKARKEKSRAALLELLRSE